MEPVSKKEGLGWLKAASTSSGIVLCDVGLEHKRDEVMDRTCDMPELGGWALVREDRAPFEDGGVKV
jgi:hypothetical protein